MMLRLPPIKVVIVGDGAVSKTSLVITSTEDKFPGEYIPYVVEKRTKNRIMEGKPLGLELWDTPAQDGYDRLRPQCYTKTDVFFICFSIAESVSLESVMEKWYPEVNQHSPNTPIFLVGTKLDLRNDEKVLGILRSRGKRPVTTAQALKFKDAIGACRYIECSSLTRENVENLFDEVLTVVLQSPRKKKSA